MWLEKIFSQLRGWPKKIRYRPNAFCFRITKTPRIFHLLTRMITAKEDNRSNIRIPWVPGYQRFFSHLRLYVIFFLLLCVLLWELYSLDPQIFYVLFQTLYIRFIPYTFPLFILIMALHCAKTSFTFLNVFQIYFKNLWAFHFLIKSFSKSLLLRYIKAQAFSMWDSLLF